MARAIGVRPLDVENDIEAWEFRHREAGIPPSTPTYIISRTKGLPVEERKTVIENRINPKEIPPLKYAPEFRQYLTKSFGEKLDEKFIENHEEDKSNFLSTFPIAMHSWNNNSRRVFHVPSELQGILRATSLKNMK